MGIAKSPVTMKGKKRRIIGVKIDGSNGSGNSPTT